MLRMHLTNEYFVSRQQNRQYQHTAKHQLAGYQKGEPINAGHL